MSKKWSWAFLIGAATALALRHGLGGAEKSSALGILFDGKQLHITRSCSRESKRERKGETIA